MLQLKVTVEGLLALPSINVWNVHGGLERLNRCIRHVLKHRIKTSAVCYLHRAFTKSCFRFVSSYLQPVFWFSVCGCNVTTACYYWWSIWL